MMWPDERVSVDVTVSESKRIVLDAVLPFELLERMRKDMDAEFVINLHGAGGFTSKRLSRRDVHTLVERIDDAY